MLIDEGLELLEEADALALLASGDVGRVGITIGALPAIFPVNYRVIDGAVMFRTAPGSKLSAAAAGAVVAFEVDDYQVADRSGWSVLVVGRADVVHDRNVTFKALDAHLEPFAGGRRTSIVRIEIGFVSGRRIVREDVDDDAIGEPAGRRVPSALRDSRAGPRMPRPVTRGR